MPTQAIRPRRGEKEIVDDLEALLQALPPHIVEPAQRLENRQDLLEIVLDLGRLPEARLVGREVVLSSQEVRSQDLEYVVARVGEFGDDNRAGIPRTLHRISALRNRKGRVVGLTCRIGRAVFGTVRLIRDIVELGQSILLLGRPGVGKTTMLREVARVLAEDFGKRVVVVDTSNEIAGDGDIPHPAIGRARRMQVPTPTMQHAVMIEAVENHMPEVIIIDEMGTELEAAAARTIAERGVQLIATAHGNTLENLILNPTLSDLVGGIQTVTLSDEEARRRGTQKSVLERKAPPTFDVVVEIQDFERVAVHQGVAEVVDRVLRGQPVAPQIRYLDEEGQVKCEEAVHTVPSPRERPAAATLGRTLRLFPYGVSYNCLEQAIHELRLPATITKNLREAEAVVTLKNYYRKKPPPLRDAEAGGIPIYVLKSNTTLQMQQSLAAMYGLDMEDPMGAAIQETEEAIQRVLSRSEAVELSPQNAYVRRLQHQMAERFKLATRSRGREPFRRVKIYKGG